MAKRGQHHNDSHGARTGRNNPKESMTITAGTPKKRETYDEQARQHRDTDPEPQHAAPERSTMDHRDPDGANLRARDSSVSGGRSGSRSNEDAGTRWH